MIGRSSLVAIAIAAAWIAPACGGDRPLDPRYPARPEGCDVQIYRGTPEGPTDNLGPVTARCDDGVAEDDCLRTLKDQACKLGGDVVWGVEDPEHKYEKRIYSGRAAHTKAKDGG